MKFLNRHIHRRIRKMPLTLEEVMEENYSELWDNVQDYTKSLIRLQKQAIDKMIVYKKQLPKTVDELKEDSTALCFQYYILLHSLYHFAKKFVDKLNEQCIEVAKENVDAENLHDVFNLLKSFNLEELLYDRVFGLIRLDSKSECSSRMDCCVFPIDEAKGCWTFRDIMGSIKHHGLCNSDLLTDVHLASIPKDSDIIEVDREIPVNEI